MNRRRSLKYFMAAFLAAVLALAAAPVTGAHSTGSCRVGFYAGGKFYSGLVTKSIRTSCPFARNVTKASLRFIIHHGGSGDGDFFVFAWSPVTQKWYHVHCFANGDLYNSYGIRADCRAGIGARVKYRAHSGSGW